jgi:hypothetical protein
MSQPCLMTAWSACETELLGFLRHRQSAGLAFPGSAEGGSANADLDSDSHVDSALDSRLLDFRKQLPPTCETVKLIDAGARLEEISEAAQKEGLTSLAIMLFEAEQEQDKA